MTTTTTFKRRLTKAELESIESKVAAVEGLARYEVLLVELYLVLDPEFTERDKVRPGDYAIPGQQATRLLEFAGRTVQPLTASNGLLTWVNVGPSAL